MLARLKQVQICPPGWLAPNCGMDSGLAVPQFLVCNMQMPALPYPAGALRQEIHCKNYEVLRYSGSGGYQIDPLASDLKVTIGPQIATEGVACLCQDGGVGRGESESIGRESSFTIKAPEESACAPISFSYPNLDYVFPDWKTIPFNLTMILKSDISKSGTH